MQHLAYRTYRSSCLQMFCKVGVFEHFREFVGKHMYRSLFFNNTADTLPDFYIRKPFFCLSLSFLNLMAEIFFKIFVTLISLFSFTVYLVRFNTNNKHHFLTYVNMRVQLHNLICFSLFTDRKEF